MNGRRLWFVGIGGAGLSAYAQLARAWGAEVGGWDQVRTPYLDPLDDVRIEIGARAVVPEGWEPVVSSAYPEVPGLRRRSSCASSSGTALDRRQRHARKRDDRGDDRLRPA